MKGISLIEVMFALVIASVIIAGTYEVFTNLQKWWVAEGLKSDTRQNARAAIDMLSRDLEMAGFQTTLHGDINMNNMAITIAQPNEIEMSQNWFNASTGSYDSR